MILASDCTHYDDEQRTFCGAPANWLRLTRDGAGPLDVLCDAHRTPKSTRITPTTPRAPASVFWKTYQRKDTR